MGSKKQKKLHLGCPSASDTVLSAWDTVPSAQDAQDSIPSAQDSVPSTQDAQDSVPSTRDSIPSAQNSVPSAWDGPQCSEQCPELQALGISTLDSLPSGFPLRTVCPQDFHLGRPSSLPKH